MAESGRFRRTEKAHTSNSLNYGHFGTAVYLEDAQAWSFLRRGAQPEPNTPGDAYQSASALPFHLVEEQIRTVVEPKPEQLFDFTTGLPSFSGFGPFLRHLPDLVAGVPQIPGSLLSSTTLEKQVAIHSNTAERLDFGNAAWLSEKDGKDEGVFIPIAAMAAGSNGQSVKLVRIGRQKTRVGASNENQNYFILPYISDQDEAWWTGRGDQVQQIHFAATSGGGCAWLAARQRSCTTIFHPLLHRQPVPARYALGVKPSRHYPASRLDTNPVLTLPSSRTGGFPHADVAFHPQDHRTIAIVDEHGNWSIWRIEGTRSITSHVLFRIGLQSSGKVYSWEFDKRPMSINPYYDGWHRLCWIVVHEGSVSRLLICNRQSAALHDMDGELLGLANMRMGSIKEGQWILDVQRSAKNQAHCFVLTSTRLLLMSSRRESSQGSENKEALSVDFSWQHFRTRNDPTMRLNVVETSQCSIVFVYSRKTPIVTTFHVGLDFLTSPLPVSIADPVQLPLPRAASGNKEQPLAVDFYFRNVQSRPSPNLLDGSSQLRFCKLFIQESDLRVTEALFEYTEPQSIPTFEEQYLARILLPITKGFKQKGQKYAELEELEDFIAEDDESDWSIEEKNRNQRVKIPEESRLLESRSTYQWEEIYDIVIPADGRISSSQRTDIVLAFKRARRHIRSLETSSLPLVLLGEAAKGIPYVAEVDEASAALSEFFESLFGDQTSSTSLSNLRAPYEPSDVRLTLLECYNNISSAWLDSLSRQIPVRIRVNKERLARIVAPELIFASTSARRIIQVPQSTQTENMAPDSSIYTPASQESHPVRSGVVSSENEEPEEDLVISRLRTLTHFTKSSIAIPASETLKEILTHLPTSIDADPVAYSWRATELSVTMAREDLAKAQQDPKLRRRAERAAEIRRRRLESQLKLSQAVREDPGMAVPVVQPSQPSPAVMQLPVREVQSSQPAAPESSQPWPIWPQVSMMQPERGQLGTHTRTGVMMGTKKGKGKGKERKAGF